jgi:hypothetical protein
MMEEESALDETTRDCKRPVVKKNIEVRSRER